MKLDPGHNQCCTFSLIKSHFNNVRCFIDVKVHNVNMFMETYMINAWNETDGSNEGQRALQMSTAVTRSTV